MSVQENTSDIEHRSWGDGMIVTHDGSSVGAWVMYDPDVDAVELDDWR